MGYLFENMKKLDIQEERRKTEEQRRRADHLEEENRKLLEYLNSLGIAPN